MFDKHLKRKVVIMFVVYRGHSDPYEPVMEWDFGVDTQPKDLFLRWEEVDLGLLLTYKRGLVLTDNGKFLGFLASMH